MVGSARRKVLVADDHRLVAECMAEQLAATYEVVAVVNELDVVVPTIARTSPEAVLLDLSFGRSSSLPLIPTIRRLYPSVLVVVVTMHSEPALAEACMRAGADFYVVKTQGTCDVLAALATIGGARGDAHPEPALVSTSKPRRSTAHLTRRQVGGISLTARQHEILIRLSAGATRAAVGADLGISAKGIDYNLNDLRLRLGIRRLVSVIAWFRDANGAGTSNDLLPERTGAEPMNSEVPPCHGPSRLERG